MCETLIFSQSEWSCFIIYCTGHNRCRSLFCVLCYNTIEIFGALYGWPIGVSRYANVEQDVKIIQHDIHVSITGREWLGYDCISTYTCICRTLSLPSMHSLSACMTHLVPTDISQPHQCIHTLHLQSPTIAYNFHFLQPHYPYNCYICSPTSVYNFSFLQFHQCVHLFISVIPLVCTFIHICNSTSVYIYSYL